MKWNTIITIITSTNNKKDFSITVFLQLNCTYI